MALEKLKINKKTETKKDNFVPFEKENVLHPMKLYLTIVTFGQADSIIKIFESVGANCNFITSGQGTGRTFMPALVTLAESKKQVVWSFVREEKSEEVRRLLTERFNTSKAARGVSFSVKLTSVAGVSVYKFLSNTRKVRKVK